MRLFTLDAMPFSTFGGIGSVPYVILTILIILEMRGCRVLESIVVSKLNR